MVKAGELKYVLVSGGGMGGLGGSSTSELSTWGGAARHRGDRRGREQRDALRGLGLNNGAG